MNKRTYVCAVCGSKDVVVDAFVRWDEKSQSWNLSQSYEWSPGGHACNEQGCESHSVKEVELKDHALELYRAQIEQMTTSRILEEFPEKSRHKAWAILKRINDDAWKTIKKLEDE